MTDPNSNDPQVPETPRDPQPANTPPANTPPPSPPPASSPQGDSAPPSQSQAPRPEPTRTEPYDPTGEEGPTVDAEAREIPREEEPAKDEPVEKVEGDHPWAMACHLAALANLCCPILGFIATMVIWQMNRSSDPEVDWHGKESLNFQLNLIPITVVLGVMILLRDACFLFGPAVILLPLVYLGALIYVLVASIRAVEGVRYRYPHIKRLLD